MDYNTNCVPGGYELEEEYSSGDDCFDYYQYPKHSVIAPKVDLNPLPPTREQNIEEMLKIIEIGDDVVKIEEILDSENMKGFDVDSLIPGRNWTLLIHACFESKPGLVEFLLEKRGASSMKITRLYETPMIIACKSTKEPEDIIQVLKVLSKHPPLIIDSEDSKGMTSLMHASSAGYLKVVEYLLTFKPLLDACDHEGQTALMHALLGKHTDVAMFLIKLGADISAEDKRYRSARDIAGKKKLNEILELFPKPEEVYEVPSEFLNYSGDNMFSRFDTGGISPLYFPDVNQMLLGMDCQHFIKNFARAHISLEEFLTISDERLKQIGILYPFQRNVIKKGLKNFYNQPWKSSSIPIIRDFSEIEVTGYDFLILFSNILKQTMILKCQILQMSRSFEKLDTGHIQCNYNFDRFDEKQIKQFRKNTVQLKRVLMEFNQKSLLSSMDTQKWNRNTDDMKSLGSSFKYAIFILSSTIFLYVFGRFVKR